MQIATLQAKFIFSYVFTENILISTLKLKSGLQILCFFC